MRLLSRVRSAATYIYKKRSSRPGRRGSDQLLSGALEEELDHGDLEGAHDHHQAEVEDGEPEDSVFGGLDGALVAVVSGLVVVEGVLEQVQGSLDLVDGELHAGHRGVLGGRVGQVGLHLAGLVLVLHLDLEVNHLLGKGGHLVVEAELVLARLGRHEGVVALSLLLLHHNQHLVRALDGVVDVKRPARLHGEVVADVGVRLVIELVEALLLVGSQRERQGRGLGKPQPAAHRSPSKQ